MKNVCCLRSQGNATTRATMRLATVALASLIALPSLGRMPEAYSWTSPGNMVNMADNIPEYRSRAEVFAPCRIQIQAEIVTTVSFAAHPLFVCARLLKAGRRPSLQGCDLQYAIRSRPSRDHWLKFL